MTTDQTHILFPMFPHGEECALWLSRDGVEAIDHLFQKISAWQEFRPFICTDSKRIAQLARKAGLPVAEVRWEEPDPPLLPRGTAVALAALQQSGTGPKAVPVLVWDFWNPRLDRELLTSAVSALRDSGMSWLASVVVPEDHPCQMDAYLSLVDLGIVYLPEADIDAPLPDSFTASRRFSQGWSPDVLDREALFQCLNTGLSEEFVPVDMPVPEGLVPWRREGTGHARRLFRNTDPEAPHVDGFDVAWAELAARSCAGAVEISMRLSSRAGSCVFHVFPFTGEGIASPGDPAGKVPGRADASVSRVFPSEGVSGFIVFLFQEGYSGEYDLREPFEPDSAPWEVDGKGHRYLKREKQRVVGRQQFPEIYTPGSLFVLALDENGQWAGQGDSPPYYFPENAGRRIGSIVGMLAHNLAAGKVKSPVSSSDGVLELPVPPERKGVCVPLMEQEKAMPYAALSRIRFAIGQWEAAGDCEGRYLSTLCRNGLIVKNRMGDLSALGQNPFGPPCPVAVGADPMSWVCHPQTGNCAVAVADRVEVLEGPYGQEGAVRWSLPSADYVCYVGSALLCLDRRPESRLDSYDAESGALLKTAVPPMAATGMFAISPERAALTLADDHGGLFVGLVGEDLEIEALMPVPDRVARYCLKGFQLCAGEGIYLLASKLRSRQDLYRLDPGTGAFDLVGRLAMSETRAASMCLWPGGFLFGCEAGVTVTDKFLRPVQWLELGTTITFIGWDASGGTALAFSCMDNTGYRLQIKGL